MDDKASPCGVPFWTDKDCETEGVPVTFGSADCYRAMLIEKPSGNNMVIRWHSDKTYATRDEAAEVVAAECLRRIKAKAR